MALLPAPTADPRRGRTRSQRWERLGHGLYAPRRVRTLAEDLAAWQLVLPKTAAFSHLTAAELRGWWLPAPLVHPVFAAMSGTSGEPRRPGLFVCRHPKPVAVNLVDGLRVTTAAETLIAAARDLGVLDLVIMGDSALRLSHCTITDLKIAAGARRRGAPLLRQVIPLLDRRSESPWESVMRVLHRAADIPVEPQHEVVTERGRFLARVDLWIVGTRRIHEYDGAVHREADTHRNGRARARRYLSRDRLLLADHWQRYGYTSDQLLGHGGDLIAEVDRLLGRTWDPLRLAAWNALIASSLYGPAGRARARRQWARTTATPPAVPASDPQKVGGDCPETGAEQQPLRTFGKA